MLYSTNSGSGYKTLRTFLGKNHLNNKETKPKCGAVKLCPSKVVRKCVQCVQCDLRTFSNAT